MRSTRVLAVAAATALLTAGPLAGLAVAADDAPAGIGTGTVTSTAIRVELGPGGDLLSVRVLGDDGSSTIDPAKGTPTAGSMLQPLTVTSKTVPALNVTVPAISSSSTGAEDKKSVEPALPSTAAFGGSLNAVLSSVVDATGARSGLTAGLANLELAGGLVSVPTGAVQSASRATGDSSAANRAITIPEVRVLDLAAVLDGLGLELTDLNVDQVLALLSRLGITLPGIADPAAAVAALDSVIDTLQATAAGPITAELCATVDGLLQGPLGGVTGIVDGAVQDLPQVIEEVGGALPTLPSTPLTPGGGLPSLPGLPSLLGIGGSATGVAADALLPSTFSCTALTGTVQDLLDTVQATLGQLLAGSLVELGETALLTVKDVEVGLEALATDAVGTSIADVTASIGSVQVGALPVPGVGALDLTAPAAALQSAADAIQRTVGSVLAGINASLADLVQVELLEIAESVAPADGYTRAASTVTAVKATLSPPAGLASIVPGGTAVGTVLGDLSTTVPAIAPLMGQLEVALGGLQALSAPSVVTVGELAGEAAFRPVAAQVEGAPTAGSPGGELPRTGGAAALPAMAAVVLAGLALAIRRVLRSATS